MLQPPSIPHGAIVATLQAEYGLQAASLEFLPVGADLGTAVYRATLADGTRYFAKLRLGPFDEIAALAPHWLVEQGIAEVMAPLAAGSGLPWARADGFTLLLYPFIDGRDAYEALLTDAQWRAFGSAIRRMHDAPLPPTLASRVPQETYTPRWRVRLRGWMERIDEPFGDAVAQHLAAFLRARRAQVDDLLERTDRLAQGLQAEPPPFVLCHTDLHAGNLLVADDGRLFIVDWDAPLLAPRERDLMYPGGGQGFLGRSPSEEEQLFYAGYGPLDVDRRALAYYRLERIVEDLAIFCEQLLGGGEEGAGSGQGDREQALRWAMSNFAPGGVLEIARRTA